MQGISESDFHTYTVPSYADWIDDISYLIAQDTDWRELLSALNAGEFPEQQSESISGVMPEEYKAGSLAPMTDKLGAPASGISPGDYVVDVRNGSAKDGVATSVSDMLVLAGYNKGEIGNANAYIYDETLVIYNQDSDKAAADDIRARIGCGRVIASLGRYSFDGNILVVVGGDFSS
jgi:hypothetical protein